MAAFIDASGKIGRGVWQTSAKKLPTDILGVCLVFIGSDLRIREVLSFWLQFKSLIFVGFHLGTTITCN